MVNPKGESDARRRALGLLAVRARSIQEMRQRLNRAGFPAEIIAGVIDWLRDLGYLDDRHFAQEFIESKMGRHPQGRLRVRYELLQKGVDRDIVEQEIEAAFSETWEVDAARRLLRKAYPDAGQETDPQIRRKMTQYLLRRGFPTPVVHRVVREIVVDPGEFHA